jgi:hypothetical protein
VEGCSLIYTDTTGPGFQFCKLLQICWNHVRLKPKQFWIESYSQTKFQNMSLSLVPYRLLWAQDRYKWPSIQISVRRLPTDRPSWPE